MVLVSRKLQNKKKKKKKKNTTLQPGRCTADFCTYKTWILHDTKTTV